MQSSFNNARRVAERHDVTRCIFEREILPEGQPIILRGLVAHWAVVEAARVSAEAVGRYLKGLDNGTPIDAFFGEREMAGRYFYNDDMSGFNFRQGKASLSSIVDLLIQTQDRPEMMIYAGSATASDFAPRFAVANVMALLDTEIEPRLWLGNNSRIAAHYDMSRNVACCVAGRRRFTIFPPDQISNLYLGPLEFTMAGQPASMVDFHRPDYQRYPKFRLAEQAAVIAELEPGDAIYIPALWWHHVEAFGQLNLLANYWWRPPNAGTGFEAMMLSMLDLRDQELPDKAAWKAFFDHFVFSSEASRVAEHLPKRWQTVTGPKNRQRDDMVKAFIGKRLFGHQSEVK